MPKPTRSSERRDDALSRERIVDAAIALLDDDGEDGLTFRALATRLETGAGAIYWHVANKNELLVAASDAIVTRALGDVASCGTPHETIRSVALCLFDTIDAHPWLGTQLSRAPWETATLRVFERIGHQLQALAVKADAQFASACALLSYIIGVSSQNAGNGLLLDPSLGRTEFLEIVAAKWQQLDAQEFPFTRQIAATQLRDHDDRADFLAGLELILAGIAAAL